MGQFPDFPSLAKARDKLGGRRGQLEGERRWEKRASYCPRPPSAPASAENGEHSESRGEGLGLAPQSLPGPPRAVTCVSGHPGCPREWQGNCLVELDVAQSESGARGCRQTWPPRTHMGTHMGTAAGPRGPHSAEQRARTVHRPQRSQRSRRRPQGQGHRPCRSSVTQRAALDPHAAPGRLPPLPTRAQTRQGRGEELGLQG